MLSNISGVNYVGGMLKPPSPQTMEPSFCDDQVKADWNADVRRLTDEVVLVARESARLLASDPSKALRLSNTSRELRQEVGQLKGDWAPCSTESRAIVLGAMQACMLAGALDAVVYHAVQENPQRLGEERTGQAYSDRIRAAANCSQPPAKNRDSVDLQTYAVQTWDRVSRSDAEMMAFGRGNDEDRAWTVIYQATQFGNTLGEIVSRGEKPATTVAELTALTASTTQSRAAKTLEEFGQAIRLLPGVEGVEVGPTSFQKNKDGYQMKQSEPNHGLVITARDEPAKEFLSHLLAHQIKDTEVVVHLADEPLPRPNSW